MSNYSIICSLILLIILIFVIAIELNKSSGKKAALGFLQDLGDEILKVILTTIDSVPADNFPTLDDFTNYLIEAIYNNVWDLVSEKANSDDTVDKLTKAIFKYIDHDTLTAFIDKIIINNNLNKNISDKYAAFAISKSYSVVEEDEKLEVEYSDAEQYFETTNDEDLAPVEDEVHTEEEIASINPAREDEEEKFDVEDDSMEIITDKKEIITAKSKTGQDLYYEVDENGKKKRVSKEYALKQLGKKVE